MGTSRFWRLASRATISPKDKKHNPIMEEIKMKDLIDKTLKQYKEHANKLNKDAFLKAVSTSFTESKNARHYVVVIPVDLDDFYTPKQHREFERNGFSQSDNPAMFNNMLLASPSVAAEMSHILKTEEGMHVDLCSDQNKDTMYVISLEGIDSTHFRRDFSASRNQGSLLD